MMRKIFELTVRLSLVRRLPSSQADRRTRCYINAKKSLIITVALFLSACAGSDKAGSGAVRIETYPLDGICKLKGHEYSLTKKTPANLVIPLSAAPVQVACSTESGYEGAATLSTTYDPWSPANIGTLGLGYLLDKSTGSGRRFPKMLHVTMMYTEAGKLEDSRDTKQTTTAANSPKGVSQIADTAGRKKPIALKNKAAKKSTAKGMHAPKVAVAKPKIKTTDLKMSSVKTRTPSTKMPLFDADVRVHLASFKKYENAERTWQTLSRTHQDLFKGLSALIKAVDVPKKGRYHRVYAGPMADLSGARALCKSLKSRNVYCRPVASGAK